MADPARSWRFAPRLTGAADGGGVKRGVNCAGQLRELAKNARLLGRRQPAEPALRDEDCCERVG